MHFLVVENMFGMSTISKKKNHSRMSINVYESLQSSVFYLHHSITLIKIGFVNVVIVSYKF